MYLRQLTSSNCWCVTPSDRMIKLVIPISIHVNILMQYIYVLSFSDTDLYSDAQRRLVVVLVCLCSQVRLAFFCCCSLLDLAMWFSDWFTATTRLSLAQLRSGIIRRVCKPVNSRWKEWDPHQTVNRDGKDIDFWWNRGFCSTAEILVKSWWLSDETKAAWRYPWWHESWGFLALGHGITLSIEATDVMPDLFETSVSVSFLSLARRRTRMRETKKIHKHS